MLSIGSCCFGGGGGERTVLAQAELACGGITAHVRRVHVVANRFEGITRVTREVSFGEGLPIEASTGRLGAWRPREELPEHVRSERMADGDTPWILVTASDVEYRCLAEHLADIEAVFEPEHPLVIFHASESDVVPTFTAEHDGTTLSLELRTDGLLYAQLQQSGGREETLIGQMVRAPSGRVLAIAREAMFMSRLPPALADPSAMIAAGRDEGGHSVLERFPSETRIVEMAELPLPP